MNTGQPISLGWLNGLYHEHLSPRAMNDQLFDIGSNLHDTLGDVSQVVEENLREQTAFSGTLRSAKQSLAYGTSKNEVSAVITQLHKANQVHINSAQKLTVQLEKNRSHVAKLKSELIEARKAANTDYLTGLPNRRMLDDQIDSAIFAARQKDHPVSFLMGAVGGMSDITARHGLAAGDNVLRMFATELKRQLRGSQMAARFEGARFAILLPDTPNREAFAIAERVRKAFALLDWVAQHNGREIGVIASFFAGSTLGPSDTREGLVLRVHMLLEAAQSDGAEATVMG